jgi:peptidoglycan/xylan/chitin deacetylase (PgdA/CDA1 family)
MSDSYVSLASRHLVSRILHRYADWRIKPTTLEKHCYKQSDSILLTFDDDGSPQNVRRILEILADKGVKAMFFIKSDWASEHPAIIEQIGHAGHIIGNHTFSHPDLLAVSKEVVAREITKGLPSLWFRPPMGRYNAQVRNIATHYGFYVCYWTIDSGDWTDNSMATIRFTIFHELRPGAVILFHLHGKLTAELLPGLIDDIRSRGYELTAFSESWEPSPTTS